MRSCKLYFVFFTLFFIQFRVFALVTGEYSFSKRWITVSTEPQEKTLSGLESKASVFFDPIPLIPAGIGFSYLHLNIDKGLSEVVDSASYNELDLAIVTWLPLFQYEPFIALSIPVYSKLAFKMKNNEKAIDDASASGMNLDIGIRKNIFPFVSVLIKFGLGVAKIDKFENKERDFNHKFFGIGIQVGL